MIKKKKKKKNHSKNKKKKQKKEICWVTQEKEWDIVCLFKNSLPGSKKDLKW